MWNKYSKQSLCRIVERVSISWDLLLLCHQLLKHLVNVESTWICWIRQTKTICRIIGNVLFHWILLTKQLEIGSRHSILDQLKWIYQSMCFVEYLLLHFQQLWFRQHSLRSWRWKYKISNQYIEYQLICEHASILMN